MKLSEQLSVGAVCNHEEWKELNSAGRIEAMLILTSDFPTTPNQVVIDEIRQVGAQPRIAWIPPSSSAVKHHFPNAQSIFRSYGLSGLEYYEIDESGEDTQLRRLNDFDILFLSGGDPLIFRKNILSAGLAGPLIRYFATGRLIVGTSGGSMQLTRNISIFRLVSETVSKVLATQTEYEGLGLVKYELLPHLNRLDRALRNRVREYSSRIEHDIIGLEDGAAIIHHNPEEYRCVGQAFLFRDGTKSPLE